MDRIARAMLVPEAESVLATLAGEGLDASIKLNDLVRATGLPTGHVGRHLRTLERDRLARYGRGAWAATHRGVRHATGETLPSAA